MDFSLVQFESDAPFDVFTKDDGCRRSWRKTQYLANFFWKYQYFLQLKRTNRSLLIALCKNRFPYVYKTGIVFVMNLGVSIQDLTQTLCICYADYIIF